MARVNVNGFKVTNYEFKKLTKGYEVADVYANGIEYTWQLQTGAHMRAVLVEEGYMIYFDWLPLPNDDSIEEVRKRLSSATQAKAGAKYDAENTRQFAIKLNKKTDAKLIEALDRSPNKQALIKQALAEYIEKK